MDSFQPTLPLRGATEKTRKAPGAARVSTHAPLAGSDGAIPRPSRTPSRFNPRSPCGERRGCSRGTSRAGSFNPRSPCGERRVQVRLVDPAVPFQPTLPLRGATSRGFPLEGHRQVSTHAPLAGSDWSCPPARTGPTRFNPRSPCGERPNVQTGGAGSASFNPRSPCGERRQLVVPFQAVLGVSTHAPLAGSDGPKRDNGKSTLMFQPTLPLRGATRHVGSEPGRALFQPTLPLRGATGDVRVEGAQVLKFQPTLPLRGATLFERMQVEVISFQPTLPLRGATGSAVAVDNAHVGFNPRSPCGERRATMG